MDKLTSSSAFTRRGFLGAAGAAAILPLLAACAPGTTGGGTVGGDTVLKFWDMPWGAPEYSATAAKIVEGYAETGMPTWTYQTIQWNNFYQTFSSAIASNTGPAVSGGGGFQAFQFAALDKIAYADNLVETMKASGSYDDFLPGTIDSMKTDKGYVAMPWAMDLRVYWYKKSLLEKAGVDVPTDWDSLVTAGKALRKIGASGFGLAAGSGYNHAPQAIVTLMLNNNGGLFDKDGNLDCVTDRNIEAVEFTKQLVAENIIDPGMISYSMDNLNSQWAEDKVGFGVHEPGLALQLGNTDGDIAVASPLSGPHGDKGTLMFINNIMMYKNTPSQEASEAFLEYYLDNMITLWKEDAVTRIPVRKSIVDLPSFQENTRFVQIVDEYQPISKSYAYPSDSGFAGLAAVDGGMQLWQFAQTVLEGKTDAKKSLEDLSAELAKVL